MKTVYIFAGKQGSGKSTLARAFSEKENIPLFLYSQPLRETLSLFGLDETRENLSILSSGIRNLFGQNILESAMLKKISEQESQEIILDGVRRYDDIAKLSHLFHIILIFIDVPAEIRYERMLNRGQNIGETSQTFEKFLAAEQFETEAQIDSLRTFASIQFSPTGDIQSTLSEFYGLLEKTNP